jgi:osmotically-inducible protein OsmY
LFKGKLSREAIMSQQSVLAAVAAQLERLGKAGQVRASARDGVVTLSGRVADEDERRVVVQEVLALDEVADVHDQLEIPLPPGDPAVQLKGLLAAEGVAAENLQIEAAGGVITLKGRAQSWFDRDAAERLAWTLPGVRQVVTRWRYRPAPWTPGSSPESATRPEAAPFVFFII